MLFRCVCFIVALIVIFRQVKWRSNAQIILTIKNWRPAVLTISLLLFKFIDGSSADYLSLLNSIWSCYVGFLERLSLVDRQCVGSRKNFCPRTHVRRWMGSSRRRRYISGKWTMEQVLWQINRKELYTVFLPLMKNRFSQTKVDYAASRQQDRCYY